VTKQSSAAVGKANYKLLIINCLKVIKCRLVPKDICVNLFGLLLARDTGWIDIHVMNHERIHTLQQRELLFVPFYIIYIAEWLLRFARHRNSHEAYMEISFEKEAYAHGHDLTYPARRRHFAQWRNNNL